MKRSILALFIGLVVAPTLLSAQVAPGNIKNLKVKFENVDTTRRDEACDDKREKSERESKEQIPKRVVKLRL